ncbi:MAG: zinc ribbon domain-containing protein [Candidatus Omnitrophota bacterium]
MKKRKKIRFKTGSAKNKVKILKPDKKRDVSNYSYKIGNKVYKLTVEKVDIEKRSDQTDSIFYYSCPFCSKDFDPSIDTCPGCGKPLTRVNLKKCQSCGAKNNPSKLNCWVCSAPFPKIEEIIEKESKVLLTLNISNHFYRNTDKILGLGMRKLFDDLIACNFSKEPLEAWAKLYQGEEEFRKESIREECKNLAKESKRQSLFYNLVMVLVPIFIIVMVFVVFFVK